MLGWVSPRRTIWTICRESYCSPGVEQIIQVGRRRHPTDSPASPILARYFEATWHSFTYWLTGKLS
jgi:hypothetical protein